jgi:hypothetical protein
VWNGRTPSRFPDVIVQAHDVDDVVTAVRYASANGYRVGTCSGGRSWSGNHVRDGGLLLDVSRLDRAPSTWSERSRSSSPARTAASWPAELETQGLFFPAGRD